MDDQLDEELKNRIREVFNSVEDPSADEGWLLLREKFPEEQSNRRAFAWLWWGAAAVLFLFLTAGIWLYIKNEQPDQTSVKAPKYTAGANLTVTKGVAGTNNKKTTANTSVTAGTVNQNKKTKGIAENIVAAHPNTLNAPIIVKDSAPDNNTSDHKTAGRAIATIPLKDTTGKKIYLAQTTDSVKKENSQASSASLAATGSKNSSNTSPVIVKSGPAKSMTQMFAENTGGKTEKPIEKTKNVHFGVYAATYFNYAKGSSNNANLGAGLTADIKINKNLSLATGLTVAQNSLNFASGIPTSTAGSNFAVLNSPSVPGPSLAASYYNTGSSVMVASAPAFKNYDASLVGLDIPLNLKYELNPKKYQVYFLAGFSSGTFINEIYTYQYNYPALASPGLQATQKETSRNSFNSFYFAKTLNFALGVGYPLGKNRIILEPFLKYPLEGLGSENIRFGAGGINLKFNFQSANKK
ncbi:MAG: hypothetical protein ACHQIM_18235 [Sphingobacteriales bacterium]